MKTLLVFALLAIGFNASAAPLKVCSNNGTSAIEHVELQKLSDKSYTLVAVVHGDQPNTEASRETYQMKVEQVTQGNGSDLVYAGTAAREMNIGQYQYFSFTMTVGKYASVHIFDSKGKDYRVYNLACRDIDNR